MELLFVIIIFFAGMGIVYLLFFKSSSPNPVQQSPMSNQDSIINPVVLQKTVSPSELIVDFDLPVPSTIVEVELQTELTPVDPPNSEISLSPVADDSDQIASSLKFINPFKVNHSKSTHHENNLSI